MTLKKYNNTLVSIHWATALVVILSLLAGTFILSELPNGIEKISALQKHVIIGFLIGLTTLVRLVIKKRHAPLEPLKIESAARQKLIWVVHFSLYGVIFLMVVSGLTTSLMSGLGEVLFFGSEASLPDDFGIYLPMLAHRIFSKVLMALIVVHVAGVIYYKLKTDSTISDRMWFGKEEK